jgi:hypothetical protein
MKTLTLAGIVLIVLGIGALAYQGITYTSRETVVDIGPIHATAERERTFPLPPIVGGAAVLAGVALAVAGARQKHNRRARRRGRVSSRAVERAQLQRRLRLLARIDGRAVAQRIGGLQRDANRRPAIPPAPTRRMFQVNENVACVPTCVRTLLPP